ncbi:MAG: hypothetical protein ACO4AI_14375, partial [Prochlorothrix sp.]
SGHLDKFRFFPECLRQNPDWVARLRSATQFIEVPKLFLFSSLSGGGPLQVDRTDRSQRGSCPPVPAGPPEASF